MLPLAYLFPGYRFTAVDMKHSAVQLLQQRIQEGDVQNVDVIEGTIEQYTGKAWGRCRKFVVAVSSLEIQQAA